MRGRPATLHKKGEIPILTKQTTHFAGTIQLGTKARISDPCYDLDVWCAGTIDDVLPGTYGCYYKEAYADGWGWRVSDIKIVHGLYPAAECDLLVDIDVGVDSGQAGIFDLEYFKKTRNDRAWYEAACDVTYEKKSVYPFQAGVMDGACFVASSGYGDGSYPCYIGKNDDGQVIAIEIEFLSDEEDV